MAKLEPLSFTVQSITDQRDSVTGRETVVGSHGRNRDDHRTRMRKPDRPTYLVRNKEVDRPGEATIRKVESIRQRYGQRAIFVMLQNDLDPSDRLSVNADSTGNLRDWVSVPENFWIHQCRHPF